MATPLLPGTCRNTRQRSEVIALLQETDQFRSAQQIHAQLRNNGAKIGLTTVYRTLQTLTDLGEIDMVRLPNGEQVYRRCGREHHHHLTCRVCTRTIEIVGPGLDTWAQRIATEHGFTDVNHTLEIFGLCSLCSNSSVKVDESHHRSILGNT